MTFQFSKKKYFYRQLLLFLYSVGNSLFKNCQNNSELIVPSRENDRANIFFKKQVEYSFELRGPHAAKWLQMATLTIAHV